MACEISLGRLEPCKDAIGGIQELLFLNYQEYQVTETTAGVIDGMLESDGTTAPTAYRYILRGANSDVTQNINSSRDNGTTFIEQVITATLKKMTAVDNEEFMLMIWGRPLVIFRDYAGQYWCAGLQWGCDVTGGSSQTGAAMGDLNGYNLTLTGMEVRFAPEVDSATIGTFTIIEGT